MNSTALTPDGIIAQQMPGYELRPQQVAMAGAVAAAFAEGRHLLVEAGTGVGKSFAYLIPAIELAVSSGKRVVLSTHTIALQEQLIHKDIPFLQKVLPVSFSAVLVKGRSNYLGLRRLARASRRQDLLFDSKGQLSELWGIEQWAYDTRDGTLSDLPRQPSLPVWDRIRSEADDCLGRKCATYKQCFYQRARRAAADAQILVVNHALLFSDLAVRNEGASILPDYEYVVLDEAHTAEAVAGDHLGTNLTNTQFQYVLNSLHNPRTGKGILRGEAAEAGIKAVEDARVVTDAYFEDILTWLGRGPGNGRLRRPPEFEQQVSDAMMHVRLALSDLRDQVEDENDRLEIAAAADRCKTLGVQLSDWHTQSMDGWVWWVERNEGARHKVTLCGRPVDIGPMLKERLFERVKSVVMTSATLATSGPDEFAYIKRGLGLGDSVGTLRLGSPFNYPEQMTVHIADGLPDPSDNAGFVAAACDAILKYLRLSEGRAFVLFTSYAMLQQCAERLGPALERERMPLLVQGSGMPRSMMLEQFKSVPRSVLFGADTFWAGVDVPGEALSNVIIVKLPFAAPNQPMVEARIEHIRSRGGNPFMEYQVPEAVLKFKQGVGRLIRSRADRGMVVILDPRVKKKHYGRLFLDALPVREAASPA